MTPDVVALVCSHAPIPILVSASMLFLVVSVCVGNATNAHTN